MLDSIRTRVIVQSILRYDDDGDSLRVRGRRITVPKSVDKTHGRPRHCSSTRFTNCDGLGPSYVEARRLVVCALRRQIDVRRASARLESGILDINGHRLVTVSEHKGVEVRRRICRSLQKCWGNEYYAGSAVPVEKEIV